MAITTYSEAQLAAFARAQIRSLFTDADVTPYSDWDLYARLVGAMAGGSQAHALALVRAMFPRTCDGGTLPSHARRRGLAELGPTKARGIAVCTSEIVGAVLATGSSVVRNDGVEYVTTEDAVAAQSSYAGGTVYDGSSTTRLLVSSTSLVSPGDVLLVGSYPFVVLGVPCSGAIDVDGALPELPPAGSAVVAIPGAAVPIEAVERGPRGNADPIEDVSALLTTTDEAWSPDALLYRVSGGADAESEDEQRARIVDFDAGRPAGTNVEAIRQTILAYPDTRIGEAFVFPNAGYPGRVVVVIYGPSGARPFTSELAERVETYALDVLGSEIDLAVLPLDYDGTAAEIDVTVTTSAGFGPDWGAVGAESFTVAAGSTSSVVNTTASPVGVIAPGDRILVRVSWGIYYRTLQRRVASVSTSGVTLAEALPRAPVVGSTVTSGSPAAQGVLDALDALFDSLGPGTYVVTDSKDRLRWPSPSATWYAVLSGSRVLTTIADVDGVLDVVHTSGSFATRTPAAYETIALGPVTIRYAYT